LGHHRRSDGGAEPADARDADHLRLLEAYGVLIANTDRHYGNISLLLEGRLGVVTDL
jgi:hypothetical protein